MHTPTNRRQKPLIYVVTDLELMGDILDHALRPLARRVVTFHEPVRAYLEFMEANPKPDLIITDDVTKDPRGVRFVRKIRQFHPQQKILLTSDLHPDLLIETSRVDGLVFMPYKIDTLLREVSRMILDMSNIPANAKFN